MSSCVFNDALDATFKRWPPWTLALTALLVAQCTRVFLPPSGSNEHSTAGRTGSMHQSAKTLSLFLGHRLSLNISLPPSSPLSRKNKMVFRASIRLSGAQPPHGHSSPLHLASEARCREERRFHVPVVAVERQGLSHPATHAMHHQHTSRPDALRGLWNRKQALSLTQVSTDDQRKKTSVLAPSHSSSTSSPHLLLCAPLNPGTGDHRPCARWPSPCLVALQVAP